MYHLLIVDDEPSILTGLSHLDWNSLNIEVTALAHTGLEAFNLLKMHDIQIVLTDLAMPGMDGLALIEKMRKSFPSIIIVALSGYDNFSYAKQCMKNQVFDYLLKPLDIDEWAQTFARVIAVLNEKQPRFTLNIKVNSKNHIISRVLTYIEEHYAEQITLSDAAVYAFTTPNYLSRILKEETGIGFSALLTNIRMENAKILLKDPTFKINEIAELVGYTSAKYFSEAFKKATGTTPFLYRSKQS